MWSGPSVDPDLAAPAACPACDLLQVAEERNREGGERNSKREEEIEGKKEERKEMQREKEDIRKVREKSKGVIYSI